MLAEWRFGSGGGASLHVHCHVSGEERWLAPPGLRDFIFRREMPLVRAVCGATGRHFALIDMHWMGAGWSFFQIAHRWLVGVGQKACRCACWQGCLHG